MNNDLRVACTYEASVNGDPNKSISAKLLVNKYHHGLPEDAQAFIQKLIDEDLAPRLSRVFRGVDSPRLMCKSCSHEEVAAGTKTFTCLSLPLIAKGTVVESVQAAVDKYFLLEDVELKWVCGACGKADNPRQRHDITQKPKVLLIQLLRWIAEETHEHITGQVVPNQNLVMQDTAYELQSVITQNGSTPDISHYIALAKHDVAAGQWWYYNGINRRQVRSKELDTSTRDCSYLCIYEHQDGVFAGTAGEAARDDAADHISL